MKLNDLEFVRLLPQFMRKDSANIALSLGVDGVIQRLADKIELLSTWNHIDDLSCKELDELAYELNIHWYDNNAPIETKRTLIKESDIVYARLGTAWAVERVVSAYVGESEVQEWFEYEGEPYYFKILTESLIVQEEDVIKLLTILEKVKRKSAWLEGIIMVLRGALKLFVGAVVKDYLHDLYMVDHDFNDVKARGNVFYGHLARQKVIYKLRVEEV